MSIPPIIGVFKAMPMVTAAAFAWAEGATIGLGDRANLIFNILAIGLLAYVIVRGGKSKVKDETIKDLENSKAAKEGRIEELVQQIQDVELQKRNIEQAAHQCKTEAAEWHARYDEAKEYTAEEAVKHFETALETHSGRVAGVHEVLIEQGQQNTKALGQIAASLSHIEQRLNGNP